MKRVGVLVSGGGSNLQALIDAVVDGTVAAELALVVSNRPGVYALERAAKSGIPSLVIDHRNFESNRAFSSAIAKAMQDTKIEIICLAGFMRILDCCLIQEYPNLILNIHPALLPAFGGKGMFGHHVHEAVIASGAKYSGATVHFVTPDTDVGPIIKQGIVAVTDTDTPASLAAKVLEIEHQIYPQALKLVVEETIMIDGMRVRVKKD